jgi:hypothetical protein
MLLTEYQEQAMRFLNRDVRGDSKKILHQRYGGPATPERSLNRISTSTVYDELTPV